MDLRKQADVLDGIEASIIEIYTAKAGDQSWAALLAADTWLTAAEAVDLGLADRVAVIPDAGETLTPGEDEMVFTVPDEGEFDDSVARITRIPHRATAQPHTLPSSPEPGIPTRKEPLDMSDILKAGLLERLGVTDTTLSDEQLLAAVDEVLEEQTSETTNAAPAGTVLIDSAVLTDLQASAALGRQAREEQDTTRRAAIVDTAVREGRIAPASRDAWLTNLAANEENTTSLIASLAKNTIPVTEIGMSDDVVSADDSTYAAVYGDKKEA